MTNNNQRVQKTKKRLNNNKDLKSIEEQVEDLVKTWLRSYGLNYFTKNDNINPEIDDALRKAPSKAGGGGGNYPDIRLFLASTNAKSYPIVIEVKGTQNKLIKLNISGEIDNTVKNGKLNYQNIKDYAVNGAVHYAEAIIDWTESYKEVIAIGINGYKEAKTLKIELGVYYLSAGNLRISKKVDNYSDLSFLAPENFETFIKQIEQLKLTAEEIEAQSWKIEERIEKSLKGLNQSMQDDLRIFERSRVQLVAGMIMAGLGVKDKVTKLEVADLKGEKGLHNNDGKIIINKICDFLTERDLPPEKKNMIINNLEAVIVHFGLYNPINGESKLKTVYRRVKSEILPIFESPYHLDFTGKLFNVLNEWVDVPDGDKNDVVLTPRYVTKMMAKLAKVDRNSYVWDYAAGSAGFLISSMELMIEDAEANIQSPAELARKLSAIKIQQLLGIEKLPEIYLLAVLNMILMGDGSTNILQMDSIKDYDGKYEQGQNKDKMFPANVFLLNPPYSAEGKGFIFAKKALAHMNHGRAVILIQENAGLGNGLPYTKELLENHTLLASIHMADIFYGKSGVETAIFVFEIGKKHDENQIVKFINMSNDGYTRTKRRKSTLDVNLRNTDHAKERYNEVVAIINDTKRLTTFYSEAELIEDTITLQGNDWTFSQHKKNELIPVEADFKKVIYEYFTWAVKQMLNRTDETYIKNTEVSEYKLTTLEKELLQKKIEHKPFRVDTLFGKATRGKRLKSEDRIDGQLPFVTAGELHTGISAFIGNNVRVFQSNTITIDMFGSAKYRNYCYGADDHIAVVHTENVANNAVIYITAAIHKASYNTLWNYSNNFYAKDADMLTVYLPATDEGIPDYNYMEKFILVQQKLVIKDVIEQKKREIAAYKVATRTLKSCYENCLNKL